MTFVGKCFGSISNCFYGTGEWDSAPKVPVLPALPDVLLDTSCMGRYRFCRDRDSFHHMVKIFIYVNKFYSDYVSVLNSELIVPF